MGIYVKYMEMPEGCVTCYLKHDCCDFKQQISSGNIIKYIDKRLDTCPLIEVTEPHGRLIDADKLKPSHYEEIYADDEYVYRYYSEDDIGAAPTVIEAEDEWWR